MSRWKEEFDIHPIHETLRQSREWLKTKIEEPDKDHATEKRRLNKVLNRLSTAIKGTDKEAAPIELLNQVNQHLQHQYFWNNLSNYSSTPETQYLTAANNHITAIIPIIYQLAAFPRDASEAAHEETMQNAFDEFSGTLSEKVTEFSSAIEEQKEKFTLLSENQETLESSLDELSADHDEKLNDWQTEFTENQTTRAEGFSDAQIERTKDFEDWVASFKKESNATSVAVTAEWEKTLSKFYSRFKKDIDGNRADAESRHKSILEMHGLVAEDSVAGGYKQLADHERDQADYWRKISIGFIAVTTLWIGFTYLVGYNLLGGWFSTSSTPTWAHLVKAASLTGVLLFGAVYASKQSSLHRNNEKKTRWFALEVKAIDPFISSLTVDQQHALKEKFSEKLFGQNSQETTVEPANFDPNIFKSIGDMVGKIIQSSSK